MKTNTVFIIGGLALLGFVFLRKKVQTTGSNAAPTIPEQTAPTTQPASGNTVNPYGLTQEQAEAIAKLEAFEALQGATIVPWNLSTGNTPWVMTGGQPGGGFLLPF